jgi:error-prone DNA polymerase
MTIGRHPMAHRREEMERLNVVPASALSLIANGRMVRVAGNVIVRQRPGTAKGILFLSLEDETGISNVIVMPDIFEEQRMNILGNAWLLTEGKMQNVDGVMHVRATKIIPLTNPLALGEHSHNFR